MPIVIAGFPGIGKSTLFKQGVKCIDSDSSKFNKSDFPANYIEYIKEKLKDESLDYIFVSTHASVRHALVAAKIPYILVYPKITLKQEYLQRYRDRGSPEAFIELMDRSWNDFIVDCASQHGCERVILTEGQYLSDILNK